MKVFSKLWKTWSSSNTWLMFSWHHTQHGSRFRLYGHIIGLLKQCQIYGKRKSWKSYFDYFGTDIPQMFIEISPFFLLSFFWNCSAYSSLGFSKYLKAFGLFAFIESLEPLFLKIWAKIVFSNYEVKTKNDSSKNTIFLEGICGMSVGIISINKWWTIVLSFFS